MLLDMLREKERRGEERRGERKLEGGDADALTGSSMALSGGGGWVGGRAQGLAR